jgi:hypothetical protein
MIVLLLVDDARLRLVERDVFYFGVLRLRRLRECSVIPKKLLFDVRVHDSFTMDGE